jgi:flavin reductase (DIM6/NTAB) family NADH-FMN oxidoreductase RutF
VWGVARQDPRSRCGRTQQRDPHSKDLIVSTPVTPQQFRETLALWPSGVTILTARDAQGPVGMTVSSFSSLSLDPPLILACIAGAAKSHDGLVHADGFAVHVLARGQEDYSRRFAAPGPEKFDAVEWVEGPFGAPLLPLGVARLVCEHAGALDGGDHTILLGRVIEVQRSDALPLLYWDRDYRSVS